MIKKTFSKLLNKTKKVVAYDDIKKNHNNYMDIINKIKKPMEEQARIETFEIAMKRQNLNQDDIKKVHSNLFIVWISAILFSIFSVVIQGIYIYKGFYFGAIAMVGVQAILLAIIFEKQFRMYQIQNKNLCSVNDFLKSNDRLPRAI